jgi:transposase InsO family protein
MGQVARELGVSRRTGFKWRKRFLQEGEAGLFDRSSRPHRMPRLTESDRTALILTLRYCRMSGPAIAACLQMSRSTVARVLKRANVARLRDVVPREPVVRYEYKHPGELIHIDIKKLGRIRGVGHRITGIRRHCTSGIGWEYVHICIDDHSRLAYVEVLGDERPWTCRGFLKRALAFYSRHAIRVRRLMTDNGNGYRSRLFARACELASVRHLFTQPYRPQTNGKAERFHPDAASRMGLRLAIRLFQDAARRLGPMDTPLQSPAIACRSQSQTANLPGGMPRVNNVSRNDS